MLKPYRTARACRSIRERTISGVIRSTNRCRSSRRLMLGDHSALSGLIQRNRRLDGVRWSVDTVTAKYRFALIEPHHRDGKYAVLDLRLRMLLPHELALARASGRAKSRKPRESSSLS